MRHCADDQVVLAVVRFGDLEPMFALDLLRASDWISDFDVVTEPLQPLDEVEAPAVAEVRDILLEGKS